MKPDPDERALEIFERALDLEGSERAAYLSRACGHDAELLAEVQSLLEHSESAPTGFLEPISAGQVLPAGMRLGEFALMEEIGRGASAVVYRARQESLSRDVAVKVLVGGQFAGDARRERFEREARLSAALSHPSVVPVISHGEHEGQPWFAMEWIRGHDLSREISLQRQLGAEPAEDIEEPLFLPPRGTERYVAAVAGLVRDAASALDHAHSTGLIHRDVKPSNMLIDPGGRVRLVDFGIAKVDEGQELTETDALIGSLPYMSPEQAGMRPGPVGPLSDVYSLGTVLYELLTLRRAHPASQLVELLEGRREDKVVPLRTLRPDLPRDLCTICETAMAADLQLRYPSAGDLERDLARFLRFEAIHARQPGILARAMRGFRRYRRRWVGAALAVVALGAGLLWSDHRAQGLAFARSLEPLKQLDGVEDWSDLELPQLASARSQIRRVKADAVGRPEQAEWISDLERRLEDHKAARRARLEEEVRAGFSKASLGPYEQVAQDHTVAAIQEVGAFHAMFPEEPPLVSDDVYWPRVEVSGSLVGGAPAAGVVGYRKLDLLTGVPEPFVKIGTLPLDEGKVPVGPVRIVVHVDGVGVREFTRMLAPGARESVSFRVRPESETGITWQRLPAGEVFIKGDASNPLGDLELTVESFDIAVQECSARQYKRFLLDHPEAYRPEYLEGVQAGSPDEDLPIVFVPWSSAVAFCEWAGARLPTRMEWEWAVHGEDQRPFPWGADYGGQGNTGHPKLKYRATAGEHREYIRITAAPVYEGRGDVSTAGVLNLLTNVMEWSETHGVHTDHGRLCINPDTRLVLGCGLTLDLSKQPLDRVHVANIPIGDQFIYIDRGLRCARSLSE